jgi:hypothetical protein
VLSSIYTGLVANGWLSKWGTTTGCKTSHVTDGRMRVWRPKKAYIPRNIQPTVPYGGGSVMVWGCISHDYKLDLVTIQGNLTGIRCYPWSAGSRQIFHIVVLCVFSHQSSDYSIVVAHLTFNSFEGHPCRKSVGLKSRRVIKRPLLADRH